MPQRTDIFALGRLGLTSGEGRRLELHVALAPLDLGGERYAPIPARPGAARHLAHDRQRLRAAPALLGRADRPVHALPRPGRADFDVDAREVDQPGAATRSCSSPYVDADDDLDLARLGARRLRARPARPDRLHARLPGPLPRVRREPQRRPEHAHEAEPDPRWAKLSEIRFD